MLRMTSTLAVPAADGFDRLHVACAPDLGSGCIHPMAAMIARVAGASLITRCVHTAPPRLPADCILTTAAADACGRPACRQRRLPAGGPLDVIACRAREEGADLVAYVDDSASASCDADGDVVASRRGAVIEWWLAGLVEQCRRRCGARSPASRPRARRSGCGHP